MTESTIMCPVCKHNSMHHSQPSCFECRVMADWEGLLNEEQIFPRKPSLLRSDFSKRYEIPIPHQYWEPFRFFSEWMRAGMPDHPLFTTKDGGTKS